MSVFLPLIVLALLMLPAAAVLELWSYGPLGWLAAVALVGALAWSCRWTWRTTRRWWAMTKAPDITHPVAHDRRRHQRPPAP